MASHSGSASAPPGTATRRCGHAERVAECGEAAGGPFVEEGQQRRVLSEKRERLIVHTGEAMGEQGRAPLGDDRRDQLLGRYRPVEHGASPHLRRQGHRDAKRADVRGCRRHRPVTRNRSLSSAGV